MHGGIGLEVKGQVEIFHFPKQKTNLKMLFIHFFTVVS